MRYISTFFVIEDQAREKDGGWHECMLDYCIGKLKPCRNEGGEDRATNMCEQSVQRNVQDVHEVHRT